MRRSCVTIFSRLLGRAHGGETTVASRVLVILLVAGKASAFFLACLVIVGLFDWRGKAVFDEWVWRHLHGQEILARCLISRLWALVAAEIVLFYDVGHCCDRVFDGI